MVLRTQKFLFYLLLIIIWEAVYSFNIWSPILFPSPITVFKTLVMGFGDHTYIVAILASMQRILISYIIALVVGISIGLIMGRFKIVDATFGSLVVALQSIPSVVWLPLALLWFGMNEKAIIFITTLGGNMDYVNKYRCRGEKCAANYFKSRQINGGQGI